MSADGVTWALVTTAPANPARNASLVAAKIQKLNLGFRNAALPPSAPSLRRAA